MFTCFKNYLVTFEVTYSMPWYCKMCNICLRLSTQEIVGENSGESETKVYALYCNSCLEYTIV